MCVIAFFSTTQTEEEMENSLFRLGRAIQTEGKDKRGRRSGQIRKMETNTSRFHCKNSKFFYKIP